MERCGGREWGHSLPSPGVPPSPDPASHEATHHLLRVLRAPGVGKADERAVDSDPGTPLQLGEVGGRWVRSVKGTPMSHSPTNSNPSFTWCSSNLDPQESLSLRLPKLTPDTQVLVLLPKLHL